MSEQHPNTEPTSDEPIFWKDGKQFIRLYYFMPEKHLLDVIMNDEIKASIPAECNDPLEFLPSEDSDIPNDRISGGFISFSSRFSSSLMWSHYADSHRGVCLQFDFPISRTGRLNEALVDYSIDYSEDSRKRLSTRYVLLDTPTINEKQFLTLPSFPESYRDIFIAEVNYSKERPTQHHSDISVTHVDWEIVGVGISTTFYTKSEEWRYEKEWRIFIHLGGAGKFDGKGFFITGLTQYLSGIILGTKFSKDRYLMEDYIQQAVQKNPHRETLRLLHCSGIHQASYHPIEYKIIVQ